MKKLQFHKITRVARSGQGANAIHSKAMKAFSKSIEEGVEFCNENGYEYSLKNNVLTINKESGHGFYFSAIVTEKETIPEINVYKISDNKIEWDCGDHSGTVFFSEDEKRGSSVEWDDSDVPDNYEEIEEAVLEKIQSLFIKDETKSKVFVVVNNGIPFYFSNDNVEVIQVDLHSARKNWELILPAPKEDLEGKFPQYHEDLRLLDLTIGSEYDFKEDQGIYQGKHGEDYMFLMDGTFFFEEDLFTKGKTTAGKPIAGLARIPKDVVLDMLERQNQ